MEYSLLRITRQTENLLAFLAGVKFGPCNLLVDYRLLRFRAVGLPSCEFHTPAKISICIFQSNSPTNTLNTDVAYEHHQLEV